MDPDLNGRSIVITGAASGIGRATAVQAAARGADLTLVDIDHAGLDELGAELATDGARATVVALDITDPAGPDQIVRRATDMFGSVDGLVTSAGTTSTAPAIDLTLDEWHRVLALNLTATFTVCQAAARAMIASGRGGSIVTVSSTMAATGQAGGAHYAASKAGVIALTKSLARELGPAQIRVNSVAPGPTESPLMRRVVDESFDQRWASISPLGRIGQPDDLAAAICFFLSPASDWITGQTLYVNGGGLMP